MKFGKAYNGRVKRRHRFNKLNTFALLCLVSVSVFMVAFYWHSVRPTVLSVMENKIGVIAVKEINKGVAEVLKNTGYDDIIDMSRTDDGYITSIAVDSVVVNRIKSDLTLEITKKIENLQRETVYIPLGSLVGNEFFAGLGPNIPAYIAPYGIVSVDFKDEFVSVGINQVKHVVYLNVKADMSMIMTGIKCNRSVSTDILVAQTVISGQVPDFYTDDGLIGLTK